jgi:hypothetical protein
MRRLLLVLCALSATAAVLVIQAPRTVLAASVSEGAFVLETVLTSANGTDGDRGSSDGLDALLAASVVLALAIAVLAVLHVFRRGCWRSPAPTSGGARDDYIQIPV